MFSPHFTDPAFPFWAIHDPVSLISCASLFADARWQCYETGGETLISIDELSSGIYIAISLLAANWSYQHSSRAC